MQRSESIAKLADALSKAQAVIQGAVKGAENPHLKSKYADLQAVWEACRAHLTSHGIAVVQSPEAIDATVTVTTLLAHSSGEWVSGALTVKAKDASPQSVGSAITYARRYGLSSMVGVAPADDDAEAAQPARQARPRPVATPSQPSTPMVITDAQRERFWTIVKAQGWTKDDATKLLARFGFDSSKVITVDKYDAIVRVVETGEDTQHG